MQSYVNNEYLYLYNERTSNQSNKSKFYKILVNVTSLCQSYLPSNLTMVNCIQVYTARYFSVEVS